MAPSTYLILVTLFCYSICDNCVIRKPKELLEKKLHDDILRDYHIGMQPKTNNTNGVEVMLIYVVKGLFLNDDKNVVTIFGRSTFLWTDDRLTWDFDKYEGIKSLPLYNYEIWSPGLKLRNSAKVKGFFYEVANCRAENTGKVKCNPKFEHEVMCNSTLINWPYDSKICVLKLDDEVWMSESDIIFSKVLTAFVVDSRSDWRLTFIEKSTNVSCDHQLVFEFIFQRFSEYLEVKIVVPCIVVSVLTIVSLLLNVNDARLGILCFSLFCHFAVYNEIGERIPMSGAVSPSILLFISGSTSCTLLVLFLTVFLRYLSKLSITPPVFMIFLNKLVFNSLVKHLVIPRWKTSINKDHYDEDHNTEWIDFSNLTNSFSFYVVTFAYIILFCLYMPR